VPIGETFPYNNRGGCTGGPKVCASHPDRLAANGTWTKPGPKHTMPKRRGSYSHTARSARKYVRSRYTVGEHARMVLPPLMDTEDMTGGMYATVAKLGALGWPPTSTVHASAAPTPVTVVHRISTLLVVTLHDAAA
jgi:hypothetical protein